MKSNLAVSDLSPEFVAILAVSPRGDSLQDQHRELYERPSKARSTQALRGQTFRGSSERALTVWVSG